MCIIDYILIAAIFAAIVTFGFLLNHYRKRQQNAKRNLKINL